MKREKSGSRALGSSWLREIQGSQGSGVKELTGTAAYKARRAIGKLKRSGKAVFQKVRTTDRGPRGQLAKLMLRLRGKRRRARHARSR